MLFSKNIGMLLFFALNVVNMAFVIPESGNTNTIEHSQFEVDLLYLVIFIVTSMPLWEVVWMLLMLGIDQQLY